MPFKTPKRTRAFTLIELAIVIVVIGILAGVALSFARNPAKQAQASLVKDMLGQLRSGAGLYAMQNHESPQDFAAYVTTAPMNMTATGNHFVSLSRLGQGGCRIAGDTISCPATALPELGAFSYTYHSGDNIELNCPACYTK